jgi:hypothetical protein
MIERLHTPINTQVTEGDEEDEDAIGGVEVYFAPQDPESRE